LILPRQGEVAPKATEGEVSAGGDLVVVRLFRMKPDLLTGFLGPS